MRRGDSRAHSCFDFIDDGLGGGDLLFQSATVPRRPELVKSNVKKKTREMRLDLEDWPSRGRPCPKKN